MAKWIRSASVTHPTDYGEEPTVTPGAGFVDLDRVGTLSTARLMKSGNTIPAVPERWLIRASGDGSSFYLNGLYNTQDEAFQAIDGLVGGIELEGTFEG